MSFYDDASWLLVPSGIEEDVVFAQKPTSGLGDLTFTRASDATYTDSTGVVRRSPYNLLTNSEDFNAWTKQQINISTNVAANPLTGVVNADLLVPDTTSNNHRIYNSATAPSSNIMSVYAKAAGYNYISFGYGGGLGGVGIIFNLSNGTVSGSAGGYSGAISPAGNGWYLCSLIQSGATNDYQTLFRWIIIRDNSTNLVFTGDGTSGVLVANAQLVEGTSALDYFPTTNRQDVPRIDFRNADGTLSSCGRLLLEPQRTNSIRNSSMVGAVAGSPGTLPTNWTRQNSSGLTQTVVGVGVENGLQYVDINLSGIATAANDAYSYDNSIVASISQTWTNSWYFKLVTSTPNLVRLAMQEFNGSTFLNVVTQDITPTTSLARYAQTKTLVGTGVNNVRAMIYVNFVIGQSYNTTIRIAAPQMELGAFATTFIPTTTAAVTRLGDSASKTGVSSLIGQTEGTLFLDFVNRNYLNTGLLTQFTISGGDATNRCRIFIENGLLQSVVRVAGVDVAAFSSGAPTANAQFKVALAYKQNDFVMYVNGTQIGTDTSGNVPACSRIGFDNGGGFIGNDQYINQAALFTTRLTNAQMAQLTTL